MATLEELTVVATQEIEEAKPMYKQVNNERLEFTEADYDQAIVDLANSKFDEQQNGYIEARQQAYGSVQDQLDMQYWDGVNGTTLWADHIAQVKADYPKPA
jgi:anaerobic selenocysteine-containing dehydrogenase